MRFDGRPLEIHPEPDRLRGFPGDSTDFLASKYLELAAAPVVGHRHTEFEGVRSLIAFVFYPRLQCFLAPLPHFLD